MAHVLAEDFFSFFQSKARARFPWVWTVVTSGRKPAKVDTSLKKKKKIIRPVPRSGVHECMRGRVIATTLKSASAVVAW